MGMFTTVYHPDDNRELQIKTGDDFCDYYHVGDQLEYPTQDGVFSSYGPGGVDDYVLLRGCRVEAVLPRSCLLDQDGEPVEIPMTETAWEEAFGIYKRTPNVTGLEAVQYAKWKTLQAIDHLLFCYQTANMTAEQLQQAKRTNQDKLVKTAVAWYTALKLSGEPPAEQDLDNQLKERMEQLKAQLSTKTS